MKLPKHRLFDYNTPGPGVEKDAPPKKGLALFWDILYRRFWKMVSVNLIYLLFSVPSLIIHYFACYGVLTLLFSELMLEDASMAATVSQMAAYSAVLIFSLFGGGASTAGATFVIKNYVTDHHAWVWSDFIRIYKKYFFKSTLIYVIDVLMLTLSGVNFWFYGSLANINIVAFLLQGLMVLVFIILLLMHSYIYPILVTYKDKSIFEIYKASFILALGKLPITGAAVALCGIISGVICFLACFVTIYAMLVIPIVLLAFVLFVNLFITYPVVLKYLGTAKDE